MSRTAERRRCRCGALPLRLAALLPLALAAGCGGEADLRARRDRDRDALADGRLADLDMFDEALDRNVPVVFVDRRREGGYDYRLQQQPYDERELLSLLRTIVRNDPALKVLLVPSIAMTRDEIGLVEAKVRETGVRSIRILGHRP